MTQGFNDATNAINNYFATQWALSAYTAYQITYRNISDTYAAGSTPWLRLTTLENDGNQISIGVLGCLRFSGVISAQIFVPAGTGTALPHAMADAAADILRNMEIEVDDSGVIRSRTPKTRAEGEESEGWYQVTVSVSFFRDTRGT